MDPRFFSILGLAPTRDRLRSGLNEADAHRDDEPWTLGVVPDSLVAAFRSPGAESGASEPRRSAARSVCDPAHSAS